VSRGATLRLAVTSDIHFDLEGHLTSPAEVDALVGRVVADRPDILVLAGDSGHGVANLRACLRAFRGAAPVVALLAGNHDLWRDEAENLGSTELFERVLPALCADEGAVWLEGRSVVIGAVAIAGTLAWYDYSAIDPAHAHHPVEQIQRMKRHVNNDAHRIDWALDDVTVARRLQGPFLEHLAGLEGRAEIERVAVVTHVPLLEEQMARKPDNPTWGFSNA
jgi:3',5'-cyclic AMP phosphodiesterase CpdA